MKSTVVFDEPLKLECQHFLDCVRNGASPITNGRLGLEVVRVLEAAGESLRQQGAAVSLAELMPWHGTNGNGNGHRVAINGNGRRNGGDPAH